MARHGRLWGIGLTAVSIAALAVGCNLVTGADRIEFGGTGGSGASATSGANGSDAASTADASASASKGAGPAVTSSGPGSGSGSSVSSSSTAMACMYPAGPYGVSQGKTVPPTLKWQGYPAGGMQQGTLTTQDLFDCDGSKGINAIMFDTAQFG